MGLADLLVVVNILLLIRVDIDDLLLLSCALFLLVQVLLFLVQELSITDGCAECISKVVSFLESRCFADPLWKSESLLVLILSLTLASILSLDLVSLGLQAEAGVFIRLTKLGNGTLILEHLDFIWSSSINLLYIYPRWGLNR